MKKKDNNYKLTTVKIITDIYSKFKRTSFDSGVTLQKVVNRTLHLYTENEEFRKHLNGYEELQCSGSQY